MTVENSTHNLEPQSGASYAEKAEQLARILPVGEVPSIEQYDEAQEINARMQISEEDNKTVFMIDGERVPSAFGRRIKVAAERDWTMNDDEKRLADVFSKVDPLNFKTYSEDAVRAISNVYGGEDPSKHTNKENFLVAVRLKEYWEKRVPLHEELQERKEIQERRQRLFSVVGAAASQDMFVPKLEDYQEVKGMLAGAHKEAGKWLDEYGQELPKKTVKSARQFIERAEDTYMDDEAREHHAEIIQAKKLKDLQGTESWSTVESLRSQYDLDSEGKDLLREVQALANERVRLSDELTEYFDAEHGNRLADVNRVAKSWIDKYSTGFRVPSPKELKTVQELLIANAADAEDIPNYQRLLTEVARPEVWMLEKGLGLKRRIKGEDRPEEKAAMYERILFAPNPDELEAEYKPLYNSFLKFIQSEKGWGKAESKSEKQAIFDEFKQYARDRQNLDKELRKGSEGVRSASQLKRVINEARREMVGPNTPAPMHQYLGTTSIRAYVEAPGEDATSPSSESSERHEQRKTARQRLGRLIFARTPDLARHEEEMRKLTKSTPPKKKNKQTKES